MKSLAPALHWPASRTLVYYRDLTLVLLSKEFKVRYKSTFMGYAWSILHPLALALIFSVFFSLFVKVPDYPLYLIASLFAWQWIANTTCSANNYFLGNAALIKKVRFHRFMLVFSSVFNESIHFVCSLPVILGFMLYYHKHPTWSWLWVIPLLLGIQLLMMTGVGLIIATSNLFFRDLERLTSLVVQMLFYMTPIVYQANMIPEHYQWILYANPFANLVLCWQGVFYSGHVDMSHMAAAAVWAAALATAGFMIYSKKVWRFAEIV